MHTEVKAFIKEVRHRHAKYFGRTATVLEIGSLNINGSPRRYFSRAAHYLGIDLGEGPGVDHVCHGKDHLMHNRYSTIISTEALEHDSAWRFTIAQAWDNLVPGGLLLITCAGPKRAEHGTFGHTPQDSPFTKEYYGNISIQQFEDAAPARNFTEYHLQYGRGGQDLYFYGIKRAEEWI